MSDQAPSLEVIRHSAAHVMAAAVKKLFPDVKFDIGPATSDGFYYDFDMEHRLADDDLKKIEKEMWKIVNKKFPFEKRTLSRDEAKQLLEGGNQTYKLERLADVPDGEEITFYTCDEFADLCRGPHVDNTGAIGAFKLLSVAGAYYRGKEDNPMLQRIYGTAFQDKKELKKYLQGLEEAKKRDHRKLGKELELFSFSENVGPGLVLWHPKGSLVRHIIESFWKKEHFKHGYSLLHTPHIGKQGLWETSGHIEFYKDAMYSPMDIDGMDYFVKPMNCPFHIEIYKSRGRSYRELPLRWAEMGTVYRYEKSGVMHGLLRVRGFTQDDAHIICAESQVASEIKEALEFSLFMWKAFGFSDVKAYLATRPEKAVGDPKNWEVATSALKDAVEATGLELETDEGGGAFYGPKIDLKVRDAIGREWQTSTIQFDFNLPERFDMTYVGDDGAKHRPYMIHRALLGSLERFFGILVEHYAGAFPLWLAPEQLRVIPIAQTHNQYAAEIAETLQSKGFRVSVDSRDESLGARIRKARNDRLPYMLVLGDKEMESKTIAVRKRGEENSPTMSLDALLDELRESVSP